MGRRSRRRVAGSLGPVLPAASSSYSDPDGGELELRCALPPRARAEYAATLHGGANRDDAWQRATELLFERLAVSWTIAGVRTGTQRELLGRYRMATVAERRFVRESLRAHLKDNFPEMEAP
ncbi:MAG: hypothetical protein M0T77_11395 [Actinomycetota bacterium]|nr:hypothetical protein [Actinomycetota bacterium]